MITLKLVKSAAKDYIEMQEPFKSRIKSQLDELVNLGMKTPNIKSLAGRFKGLFRIRCGDYRIIFSHEGEEFTVISILHRKDAYK